MAGEWTQGKHVRTARRRGRPRANALWWATATPTAADVAERLADLTDAIGSQRLAGPELDPATVAPLRRVAYGALTIEDVAIDIYARVALGERSRSKRRA